MSGTSWVRVPTVPDGPRWTTIPPQRIVLVVAHTVTAFNRLSDILDVFDSDRRIQLVFTVPDASFIPGNVETLLHDSGAIVIPWEQATETRFDLAISVHHSGDLHQIDAPLITLSHGMGYTKYGNRKPETGNRKPETYGLGEEWLVHRGEIVPTVIALSHPEQLDRLSESVPDGVSRAVVVGDPCYDRMALSGLDRDRYRRALGAGADTTVVVVTSTWGRNSLLGRHPDLIDDLVAELTVDDYAVAAVLHPNTWFGHGPLQIRYWLGDALRSGLRLVPPARGWQQAVLSADVVIGDHGAVTGYAVASGIPAILASFPQQDVPPGTAIDTMGRMAPRLRTADPLEPQLRATIKNFDGTSLSSVAELASSAPGRAAELLRGTFYRVMDLPEPDGTALATPYPAEDLLPEYQGARATWVLCVWASIGEVRARRWPADVLARRGRPPRTVDSHLVVHNDHPRRDLRDTADIVVTRIHYSHVKRILTGLLASRPGCALAAAIDDDGRCHVRHRAGWAAVITPISPDETADSSVWSSVIYSWITHEGAWQDLPPRLTLHIGPTRLRATVFLHENSG